MHNILSRRTTTAPDPESVPMVSTLTLYTKAYKSTNVQIIYRT